MTRSTIGLRSLFSAVIIGFFLLFSSCKNENKPEDPKEVAEDQNDKKFRDNEKKDDDADFLVDAAESDLMEIELGNLALMNGTNPAVKEFARKLIIDHTNSVNELKPFAEKLQVSLPAAITDKGLKKLNDLKGENLGKDFDKRFAGIMVNNHENAITNMQHASEVAHDLAVRTWASNKVPILKGHLEHAKMLKDKIE